VLPINQGVNPRIRTSLTLPCLLAALCLAAPAQAATSWGSFNALAALSCGGAPADPGTTAVDTTVAPPTAWQPAGVSVTLQGTGLGHMEYMIDCVNPQSAAGGATVPMGLEGVHTISHRAVDGGGLATAWVDETVQVDLTDPANTTVDQSGWHNSNVNVTVQGTDAYSGVGHVEWSGDSTGSGPSGSVVPVTGDGAHTLTTLVEDAVGHRSVGRTDTIRIDTAAPADSTTYPAGWQYTATTVDVFGSDSGSGVDHVEWKIDGGSVNTGAKDRKSVV